MCIRDRFGKGDLEGALADCNSAIEISPKSFQPYIYRGYVKSKMGDKSGAKADFSKAIELHPQAQKLIETNEATNAGGMPTQQ